MSRVALVIGINRYLSLPKKADGSSGDLERAAGDAEVIASRLEQYGYFQRVERLPKRNVNGKFEIDPQGKINIQDLEEAIFELFCPQGKEIPHTALLFFSGHGFAKTQGFPDVVLGASDTNLRTKWGVSLRNFREVLQQSKVREKVIILDCCHSGEILNLKLADPGEQGEGYSHCLIAACTASQQAYGVGKHGLLTGVLLETLVPQVGKAINHLDVCTAIHNHSCWQEYHQQTPVTSHTGKPINLIYPLMAHCQPVVLASSPPKKRVIGLENLQAVPVWKGREAILNELKTRILTPNTSLKMLVIVGQGGMGKTSLTAKLLEALGVNLATGEVVNCVYDKIIIYKAQLGTSFDDIAYFILNKSLEVPGAETLTSVEDKLRAILVGMAKKRYLLVLDNLEVILDQSSHQAISKEWGDLLNALVYRPHCSQVILTSREVPGDLADRRYPGSQPDTELVQIQSLGGVSTKAGVEILQQRQLQDSLADLEWISQRVEGHVFLLTQLAALGKGKPGYLRKHPEFVTQKAEPILREQLNRQTEAGQDLLRKMCVLRVPIDLRGLTFLQVYQQENIRFERAESGEPVELKPGEIQATEILIEKLVKSSLVQSRYDQKCCEIVYDLHRVIIDFLQQEYQQYLLQFYDIAYKLYFTSKNIINPNKLEDLQTILEAQYFALKSNKIRDSLKILKAIDGYLNRWGYLDLLINLYHEILPCVDKYDRPYCLRVLACIYRDLGNLSKSEKYAEESLLICKENDLLKAGIISSYGILGNIEFKRGNWDKAEQLYKQSLEIGINLDDDVKVAKSYSLLGDIERKRGNWNGAEQLYNQYLEACIKLGNQVEISKSLALLGDIERKRGNWDNAEQLYQQSLELRTELGDCFGLASCWVSLGDIERKRGNWDNAEQLYQQSLELRTELGDRFGTASCWVSLGYIEHLRGNCEKAEQLYQQALELRTELDDRFGIASCWGLLGAIERNRGNWDKAEKLYQQALKLKTELRDRSGMVNSIRGLGLTELGRGNFKKAETLLKGTLTQMEEIGMTWHIAETYYYLAQLERQRGKEELAENYYQTAYQMFQQLGAIKDMEKIEQEWFSKDEN